MVSERISLLLLSLTVLQCAAFTNVDPMVTDMVYFDVEIEGKPIGRIVIGLFGDVVPITVRNFVGLATNEKGYGYKGSRFYKRGGKDYSVLGGHFDIDGEHAGKSYYGDFFDDENFELMHYGPGWISMTGYAPDRNRAGFQIMVRRHDGFYEWWDGRHVVFGVVLKGMEVVYEIAKVEMDEIYKRFLTDVIVVDSGTLPLKKKFSIQRKPVKIKDWKKWKDEL